MATTTRSASPATLAASAANHERIQAGNDVAATLATLKDVAGIAGSFVFTHGGQLFARQMHAMFDDVALAEAAERLARLNDTFAAVGDHLDLAVIRFQDHKLYLKVLGGGMLCILADGVVNMAALRMAANLVSRRIAPYLDQMKRLSADAPLSGASQGVPASVLPSTPSGRSEVAPVVAPGTRRFRGRSLV